MSVEYQDFNSIPFLNLPETTSISRASSGASDGRRGYGAALCAGFFPLTDDRLKSVVFRPNFSYFQQRFLFCGDFPQEFPFFYYYTENKTMKTLSMDRCSIDSKEKNPLKIPLNF